MMLRRLTVRSSIIITPSVFHLAEKMHIPILREQALPVNLPYTTFSRRFLDLHQFRSKEAIEKERARLSDELSRGYFADISEIRKNNGKLALANKVLIPSLGAVKFPDLEVNLSDGRCVKFPFCSGETEIDTKEKNDSCVSLVCLSFRASSMRMVESWSLPFLDAFGGAGTVKVYEVSLIDSWLFSLDLVRQLFLKMMRKSSRNPQIQIVYSFGDNYYFRKNLQLVNLLTGYIFLLDRFGRIRWHGSGYATEEEISWLLSCTSALLEEK